MIPLIFRLLSFLFQDDTKLNPYAGGDGEYRAARPPSSGPLPLGRAPEEGAAVTWPLSFHSEWGRGQPELPRPPAGGKAGASGTGP